jgi:hypothetical protein
MQVMHDVRQSLINSPLYKVLKRLHYPLEVMLVCVRWYAASPLSLRHIEGMMQEQGQGIFVNHTTVRCIAGRLKSCQCWQPLCAIANGLYVAAGALMRPISRSQASGIPLPRVAQLDLLFQPNVDNPAYLERFIPIVHLATGRTFGASVLRRLLNKN